MSAKWKEHREQDSIDELYKRRENGGNVIL